jgi:hypothetical protein
MIVVAKRLSEIAVNEATEEGADAFGRSAFNRYYYASFLITRDMLRQLNPSWKRTPHSDIPDLLTETITKRISAEARRQAKASLIHASRASSLRTEARSAAGQLADLLKGAYEVRLVADYEPEERILRGNNVIRLSGHTLGEAGAWPKRAEWHASSLLRIWRDLALA